MRFIPCATSPSRSLLFSFRALLAVCVVAAMAIAAHAQTPPAPGGPTEGIKVHGHWTIDIKNADGTLASHHEFENALVARGAQQLVTTLAGGSSPVGWAIWMVGVNQATAPCDGPNSVPYPCVIRQAEITVDGPSESANLQVVGIPIGAPTTLRLSGSVTTTALRPSEIADVVALMVSCAPALTRSACIAGQGLRLPVTEHLLSTPISVAAGQIVQVTVDITFS